MKNNTQSPTLNKIIQVRDDFRKVYDENLRIKNSGKNIYNKRVIDKLNKELEEIGISQDLTPKEQEITLEKWFELLSNPQETLTEVPRPEGLNNTTLNSDQLENLEEFAEQRDVALKQSREKAVSDVANIQTRLKEIYDQQRIIQEQIKKAQELQPKFVGKKVYATVEQQEFIASLEAQKSFETLTEYANYQETRTDLIEQLTESVQSKTNAEKIVARTIVVQLVNDISDNELAKEKIREVAIEEAIEQSKDNILDQVLQKDEVLIETVKKGAVLEAENIKGSVFLTREIAENILPLGVVEQIYGPKQIKVVLSSVPNEQTTHEVDLEKSIRNYEINLKDQSKFLDNLKEGGVDRAKSIFRNQLYSNINTYLAKAPKGSALGKVYSSDAVKAILTQGSPNPFELKYFGKNPLLQTYFKYSPESMPYFKLFTEVTGVSVGFGVASKIIPLTFGEGIKVGKIVAVQQISIAKAPFTYAVATGNKVAIGAGTKVAVKTGVLAGFGSLLAKGAAAVGVSLGVFTAGVSTAITVGLAAVGKIINWPKVKQWFIDNKEMFVFAGAGAGLFFGGPVAGIVTGGLLMAATGTLAAFATGAFGVLGLIGRSVGIAIATPVIVTLLVLPPLVAFIMLVINNSAYVVPPSFESSSGGGYTPTECLGEPPEKPVATNVRFSNNGKYAFPTAPFETPGYACYHWDGYKSADIFSPQDKPPMVAYESGTISKVKLDDEIGGKYIILKGQSGRHYYYAHLCHVFVNSGETVKAGDVIATMDESGSGRVQHLHYAINEPPLSDTFIGGDGNVCPQKDFEEKFGFGVCRTFCVNP